MPWFEIQEVARHHRTYLVEADDPTEACELYGTDGTLVHEDEGEVIESSSSEEEISLEEMLEKWGFDPSEVPVP